MENKNKMDRSMLKIIHILTFLSSILGITVSLFLYYFRDWDSSQKEQLKYILNFHLSFLIYFGIVFLLKYILIGYLLLPFVIILYIIESVMGLVKLGKKENYKFNFSIDIL